MSPDGKYLIFSSPRSGNGDIYRFTFDSKDEKRLTSDASYEFDATYAPDGKSIVFVRESGNTSALWVMHENEAAERQLTTAEGEVGSPTFSPDGAEVYFWRTVPDLKLKLGASKARELFSVNVKSGIEKRITDNTVPDVFPAVSPDGEQLALVRDEEIVITDLDGRNSKSLGSGSEPSFSPNGKQLAVVGGRYGRQIDLINVDGSSRRSIYSKNTTVSHPVFMPDGRSILFLEHHEGRGIGNVVAVSVDGSAVRQICDTK